MRTDGPLGCGWKLPHGSSVVPGGTAGETRWWMSPCRVPSDFEMRSSCSGARVSSLQLCGQFTSPPRQNWNALCHTARHTTGEALAAPLALWPGCGGACGGSWRVPS